MKKLFLGKNGIAIVSMTALVAFFIWGFIEGTYSHAWIVFLVAGLVDVVLASLRRQESEERIEPVETEASERNEPAVAGFEVGEPTVEKEVEKVEET